MGVVRNLPKLLSVYPKAEILRGQPLVIRWILEKFARWEFGAGNVHNGIFCLMVCLGLGSVEVKSGMNTWVQGVYLGVDARKHE